ncbi:MAG: sn-glycerol-3-phosphate ABC transporter substrate-binding protein, partial [Paracoccus sp. (in: a-proteobacteria)]
MIRYTTASAAALIASLGAAQAQTSVEWWHAMGGELGARLEQIVQDFNDSQDEYRVVSSYKGTYPETMTAAIAA